MRYMLDTNICIYSIKHKPKQVFLKLQEHDPEDICISSVTYAKLVHGVEKSQAIEKNQLALVIYGNVNKRHDIAYSVTVTFTDDYDFEHWTKSKKNLLTMCINNILGYYPQSLGLIVPYSRRIQYKFSGTFRCRH